MYEARNCETKINEEFDRHGGCREFRSAKSTVLGCNIFFEGMQKR